MSLPPECKMGMKSFAKHKHSSLFILNGSDEQTIFQNISACAKAQTITAFGVNDTKIFLRHI